MKYMVQFYQTVIHRLKHSYLSNKHDVTLIDPPSTPIDFIDFFHPPLLIYSSYVQFFLKKYHPPPLSQCPRLLILHILHPLHVYYNLLAWIFERREYIQPEYNQNKNL